MTTYEIRKTGIDGNEMADVFEANTFAEIKRELTRSNTPWRSHWFVVDGKSGATVFDHSDWRGALMAADGSANAVTLKLLRECHAEGRTPPPENMNAPFMGDDGEWFDMDPAGDYA